MIIWVCGFVGLWDSDSRESSQTVPLASPGERPYLGEWASEAYTFDSRDTASSWSTPICTRSATHFRS